jgi:uncharacterized protein
LKDRPIDLIALTGSPIERRLPKLVPYLEALNKLNPVYGLYVFFGNHEYVLHDSNFNQLKQLLNEHGFKTMQNEHETFKYHWDDEFSTNRSNIDKPYEKIQKGYI